jgi:hypothetical protein
MVTRAQIERLSERVETIATASDKQRIVVVGPDETNEQALRRQGLSGSASSGSWIFIHTGVPRPGRSAQEQRAE